MNLKGDGIFKTIKDCSAKNSYSKTHYCDSCLFTDTDTYIWLTNVGPSSEQDRYYCTASTVTALISTKDALQQSLQQVV